MPQTCTIDADELVHRVRLEFDELPAMRLTLDQMARLLATDRMACARALEALVSAGYLTTSGRVYLRSAADRPVRREALNLRVRAG